MGLFNKKNKIDIHQECWDLNYYFIIWLDDHLKVYYEGASNAIDLTFHKYQYKGQEYTFKQLLERMLELAPWVRKHFYDWEDIADVYDKTDEVLKFFSLTFHSFWW